jgi:hypothetical protein
MGEVVVLVDADVFALVDPHAPTNRAMITTGMISRRGHFAVSLSALLDHLYLALVAFMIPLSAPWIPESLEYQ